MSSNKMTFRKFILNSDKSHCRLFIAWASCLINLLVRHGMFPSNLPIAQPLFRHGMFPSNLPSRYLDITCFPPTCLSHSSYLYISCFPPTCRSHSRYLDMACFPPTCLSHIRYFDIACFPPTCLSHIRYLDIACFPPTCLSHIRHFLFILNKKVGSTAQLPAHYRQQHFVDCDFVAFH